MSAQAATARPRPVFVLGLVAALLGLGSILPRGGFVPRRTVEEAPPAPTPAPEVYLLAETVGLTMQYAVVAGDRALFDRMLGVVDTSLKSPFGLVAWRASDAGPAASSAAIDDLVIARALADGAERWEDPSLKERSAAIAGAVLRYEVRDGTLVDGASWNADGVTASSSIQTSYLDLATFKRLAAATPEWQAVYDSALATLKANETPQGLFPEGLPMPGAPDPAAPAADTVVNGIPTLYCALHLAQVGAGGTRLLDFLERQLRETGHIAGRYRLADGAPVDGYESIAVYALTARLADLLGRHDTARAVLFRMNDYWHLEPVLADPAGGPIWRRSSAFDNLHALIAYRTLLGR